MEVQVNIKEKINKINYIRKRNKSLIYMFKLVTQSSV